MVVRVCDGGRHYVPRGQLVSIWARGVTAALIRHNHNRYYYPSSSGATRVWVGGCVATLATTTPGIRGPYPGKYSDVSTVWPARKLAILWPIFICMRLQARSQLFTRGGFQLQTLGGATRSCGPYFLNRLQGRYKFVWGSYFPNTDGEVKSDEN